VTQFLQQQHETFNIIMIRARLRRWPKPNHTKTISKVQLFKVISTEGLNISSLESSKNEQRRRRRSRRKSFFFIKILLYVFSYNFISLLAFESDFGILNKFWRSNERGRECSLSLACTRSEQSSSSCGISDNNSLVGTWRVETFLITRRVGKLWNIFK